MIVEGITNLIKIFPDVGKFKLWTGSLGYSLGMTVPHFNLISSISQLLVNAVVER